MAEALKGSQTSRCVVDDGLAVAASAHPASCGDLHGVVACAVGVDVHPYPVPPDGCLLDVSMQTLIGPCCWKTR